MVTNCEHKYKKLQFINNDNCNISNRQNPEKVTSLSIILTFKQCDGWEGLRLGLAFDYCSF